MHLQKDPQSLPHGFECRYTIHTPTLIKWYVQKYLDVVL